MNEFGTVVDISRPSPLPFTGLSRRTRSLFYIQLGRMLDVGLAPVRSLQTIGGQRGSGRLSRAALDMAAHVQDGGSMASALARHPNLFPANEVRLLEAAERTGKVAEAMLRISRFLDTMRRLWRKLITGLLYPVFIGLMLYALIPLLFAALFPDKFGDPVDVLIRKLVEIGMAFGAGLVVLTAWRSFSSLSPVRVLLHGLLLHLPVFGGLSRRLSVARFADTFEGMYVAGVPTPEAMARSALACGNAAIGRRILGTVRLVREGASITEALGASRAMPPMLLNMIATGEESGKLEEALHKVAEYEREDAGVTIERMAKVIPMIMLFSIIALQAYLVLQAWGGVMRLPFDDM